MSLLNKRCEKKELAKCKKCLVEVLNIIFSRIHTLKAGSNMTNWQFLRYVSACVLNS